MLASIFSLNVLQTALELGCIYALVALALFLSYSILNIADLSTDGCFTLGCAVACQVALTGHPILALFAAMAAGAKSHVYYFSQQEILDEGIWLEDGNLVYRLDKNGAPQVLIPAAEIGIVGSHNWQNAMAASLAALLMGQQPEIIAERLRAFKGVAHRMEPVATIDGVLYVNDSKGTNPDSTEKALGSYGKRPIVLIAGGRNKGSDMAVLVPLMRAHCRGVVLVGEATGDFIDAFERTDYTDYVCADSFEDAVAKAREMAQSGDVVLLSPACASWDMFDNFEQRGDLFKELVKDYAAK